MDLLSLIQGHPHLDGRGRPRHEVINNPEGMGSRSLEVRRCCRNGPRQPTKKDQHDINASKVLAAKQRIHRKIGTWSNEQLQAAIVVVDNGSSMRAAALEFGISYSTFCEWCFGERTSRNCGPPAILNLQEEEQLV